MWFEIMGHFVESKMSRIIIIFLLVSNFKFSGDIVKENW